MGFADRYTTVANPNPKTPTHHKSPQWPEGKLKHEVAFKKHFNNLYFVLNGRSSGKLRALLSPCQLTHKHVLTYNHVQYYTVNSKQGQAIKPHWRALRFELIVKLQSTWFHRVIYLTS